MVETPGIGTAMAMLVGDLKLFDGDLDGGLGIRPDA